MRARSITLALIFAALAAALVAAPALAAKRKVPFGMFGTVLDPTVSLNSTPAQLSAEMGVMARNGVESVRSNVFWSGVEPQAGVFSWGQSDSLVLAAASHGLSLLPIVEFTPAWASSRPHSLAYEDYPPASQSTFATFMTALVDRYGPHGSLWNLYPSLRRYAVRDWQVWNEPEGTYDWRGQPWPSTYLTLLRTGYQAVHAADPGAKVVLGAVVGLNLTNLEPWAEARALYKLGARRYFDVMAVNAFTYSDSVTASVDRSVLVVGKVRAVMRQFGDKHKPIWVTEVTWPASLGKIPKREYDGFETTTKGQAKRLQAYYSYIATHRSAGITRAFWYTWATSYSGRNPIGVTPTFAYTGLTRWVPGQSFRSLPVLVAYERAAARYEGCRKTSVATQCR